jgi:NADPH-dependent 2,4-dienoyl-CoA reductase/sulfur reductase-like enzyme
MRVTFMHEGRAVQARPGETIAAALVAAGVKQLRQTAAGEPRGLFCGMGACQDCLVEIEGRGAQRACMTKVEAGLRVTSCCDPLERAPAGGRTDAAPEPVETEVLVIGAGAAGLAAAFAAGEMGARVLLADERPAAGGQYYKQPVANAGFERELDDAQFAGGRRLLERVDAVSVERGGGVRTLSGTTVMGAFGPRDVVLSTPAGPLHVTPARIVVATGAYERARPAPGWTLPGVMTTGAAQTLLRSYRVLPGRRVLIAGNGPLNWQVALELKRAGAEVVALAEAAPVPGPGAAGALLDMALGARELLRQGIRYRAELRLLGIPLLQPRLLLEVTEADQGLRAGLAKDGEPAEVFEVDAVLMGYGFEPQNEILRALGCRHAFDAQHGHLRTATLADCRTSIEAVYAAGDCTGLGGAPAAEAEGLIAGHAAAASLGKNASPRLEREVAQARRSLRGHRRFQRGLWRLFACDLSLTAGARADTIVCRCESVTLAGLEAAARTGDSAIGSVKRATRAGMGRCQGRCCGPVIRELLARGSGRVPDELASWAPRPPAKPMAIADIASLRLPEDATP